MTKIDWSHLKDALSRQSVFSNIFFNAESLSTKQKEEMLKTFVLALHSEASGICDAVNYKDHRLSKRSVDTQKILYKSVDVYRYLLAIINLWDIDASEFASALEQKDDFLHYRHKLTSRIWDGQPVVLFDMDDVLAEFRQSFCSFVTSTTGIFLDPNSTEYYVTDALKKHNLNNELLFRTFIDDHGFLYLDRNESYCKLLGDLRSRGFWIQIVTSRPESNLTAFYDTFSWLQRNSIEADGVAFTPEKYVWLTDQRFFSSGKYFAIDDSSKHAAEYSKHSVRVVVPKKSYNEEAARMKNVLYVDGDIDAQKLLEEIRFV